MTLATQMSAIAMYRLAASSETRPGLRALTAVKANRSRVYVRVVFKVELAPDDRVDGDFDQRRAAADQAKPEHRRKTGEARKTDVPEKVNLVQPSYTLARKPEHDGDGKDRQYQRPAA